MAHLLENYLESFILKSNSSAVVPQRQPNDTYQMMNQKYIIHRKQKEPMLQYATLYFARLAKLKPQVQEAAELKWRKGSPNFKIVENILDIRQGEDTVIIGTLFKEQTKKPSILSNIMGVLGAKKFHNAEGEFNHGAYVTAEGQEGATPDIAVLEDISGRISIKNSDKFTISEFVSGSIMALKGKAIQGGYFEVQDYCFAGVPFNEVPETVSLPSQKRELYSEDLLNSNRQFVAFVSGLQIDDKETTGISVQMLQKFLRGEFPDQKSQLLASQITRLVIAGDSMVQPTKVDEVLRGSYRTQNTNVQVYSDISKTMDSLEQFIDGVSETMDVDIMPGEKDFSNAFLPQQPFNSCLFPQLQDKQVDSVNLVTNPHQFELNGINFLGTSGQNVADMLLNSSTPGSNDSEKCLHRIRQNLQMRHLCPTAPDTLRIYPFKEGDPFIVATNDTVLNLEQTQADGVQTPEQYSTPPHVCFSGNMQEYGQELIQGPHGKFVKLLSLPIFAKTQSVVLLDLTTMDSYEVSFEVSGVIRQAMPVVEQVGESQEEIERDMQID